MNPTLAGMILTLGRTVLFLVRMILTRLMARHFDLKTGQNTVFTAKSQFRRWGSQLAPPNGRFLQMAGALLSLLGAILRMNRFLQLLLTLWLGWWLPVSTGAAPRQSAPSSPAPACVRIYLYAHGSPVNMTDPSGHFGLVSVSIGSSLSTSLSSMYNGTVVGVGNALQATIFGVQAGMGANEILTGFIFDETGIGLAVAAFNAVRGLFQDRESQKIAAYMLWEEQLIATILAAMEDDEFGEITVELEPQCFVAGTPVATEAGLKAIEEIRPGDKVWAWNEATDEVTLRPVVNRFIHQRSEVFEIKVGRDTFKVTGEHPFYVLGKGWTPARDVRSGDEFVTSENCSLPVDAVEKHQGEVLVYNFEVSTDHNYYVGEEGILTHNANALRSAMRLTNPLLAAHHIVAIRAKGAAAARALLLAPGTGIVNLNDIRNGVALPRNLKVKVPAYAGATVHSVVHTTKYYQELADRLQAVAPGGRIYVLRQAARELRIGKFPY